MDFSLIVFGVLTAWLGQVVCADDLLIFESGDSLAGNIAGLRSSESISLSAEDRLIFDSKLLTNPAEFYLSEVAAVRLQEGERGQNTANTVVRLANGDTHRGKMSGLNDDAVLLETDYAGDLEIRREFVTQMRFPSLLDFTYYGPKNIDEWIIHGRENDWRLEEGKLSSNGPHAIGLKRSMTRSIQLSFDAEWSATTNFSVEIFASSADEQAQRSSYRITFQNDGVRFNRLLQGQRARFNNRRFFNRNRNSPLQGAQSGRFDIFADSESGSIEVYFNGEELGQWQDEQPDATNLGGCLIFENESYDLLKIGEIDLAPWDGTNFNEGAKVVSSDINTPSSEGDRVVLINGDSVLGEIGELKEGCLAIKVFEREVQIPANRVRSIRLFNPIFVEFATVPLPREYNRDVRAYFDDGKFVTFRLDAIDGDKLIGYSEAFGEQSFTKASFQRLEFNLYPDYTVDRVEAAEEVVDPFDEQDEEKEEQAGMLVDEPN